MLGFPTRRELGDCYIWGAWGPQSLAASASSDDLRGSGEAPAARGGCSSTYPVLLHHTHTLDVVQVRGGC